MLLLLCGTPMRRSYYIVALYPFVCPSICPIWAWSYNWEWKAAERSKLVHRFPMAIVICSGILKSRGWGSRSSGFAKQWWMDGSDIFKPGDNVPATKYHIQRSYTSKWWKVKVTRSTCLRPSHCAFWSNNSKMEGHRKFAFGLQITHNVGNSCYHFTIKRSKLKVTRPYKAQTKSVL